MDVKLPNLGEGADSGTVVTLFVKDGDRVEKDQPVIELENEKAVAAIPPRDPDSRRATRITNAPANRIAPFFPVTSMKVEILYRMDPSTVRNSSR